MSSNRYYQPEAPQYQEEAPHQYQQEAPQHHQQGAPQQYHPQQPSAPPHSNPNDDSSLLPTGSDRTEQVEQLQSYEARAPQTEHDKNREILQREFPKIDGSLIAAIYGDSNSLSATREMLHELSDSSQDQGRQ
jgi:hypothetical protein